MLEVKNCGKALKLFQIHSMLIVINQNKSIFTNCDSSIKWGGLCQFLLKVTLKRGHVMPLT